MDYLNSFYAIYPEFLHQVYTFLNSFANNQFGYFMIYVNTSVNFLFALFELIYFISSLISTSSSSSSEPKIIGKFNREDKANYFKQKKEQKENDNK